MKINNKEELFENIYMVAEDFDASCDFLDADDHLVIIDNISNAMRIAQEIKNKKSSEISEIQTRHPLLTSDLFNVTRNDIVKVCRANDRLNKSHIFDYVSNKIESYFGDDNVHKIIHMLRDNHKIQETTDVNRIMLYAYRLNSEIYKRNIEMKEIDKKCSRLGFLSEKIKENLNTISNDKKFESNDIAFGFA